MGVKGDKGVVGNHDIEISGQKCVREIEGVPQKSVREMGAIENEQEQVTSEEVYVAGRVENVILKEDVAKEGSDDTQNKSPLLFNIDKASPVGRKIKKNCSTSPLNLETPLK